MKLLEAVVTIRGDSLYCPLAISIDSYGNCEADCWHCVFRRLNHVWGSELKPANVESLERRLRNGIKNPRPKSPLAWALSQKKTLRLGNKTDPYQAVDRKFQITRKILQILSKLQWSAVIQTRHTELMMERDFGLIINGGFSVMPIISPGWEKDWELFERKRTTHPDLRLEHCRELLDWGVNVGVNGEPFIPGFHRPEDFERTLKKLKRAGISSYNTYNLHANDFVYKRLVKLPGVDIERIWTMNQDKNWRPILLELIAISKQYGVDLGCPDFVNSGSFSERANTCCGMKVENPCTFNAITWKKLLQEGKSPEDVLNETWDGVGDWKLGRAVMEGTQPHLYSIKDIQYE